ncbi:MAG TPA: hypothetical protein PKN61_07735 [Acidobacteriota bacterium]|nr:hypothetical protein [Acidobacteriota bacterium]HNR38914.1 hypothetical protein [Acidobacteriota bacterium]HNU00580.1 hypothetical protein [Acidobacteriota bacterium]HPB28386.1 hypothetical protein [Acidobacteriota bacterium]HQO24419.1 hypothetical protein [Acidobacteriota bacterium]
MALIVIGLVSTILAAISHWVVLRRLRREEPLQLTQWPLTITLAFFLALAGLYALWSVFSP